ncbi:MAG TPA: hypothetical protein VFZ32_02915 [Micromonosporaceae bacterium]
MSVVAAAQHLGHGQTDQLGVADCRWPAWELGASRLDGDGKRFRVFVDPAGHPFCLSL